VMGGKKKNREQVRVDLPTRRKRKKKRKKNSLGRAEEKIKNRGRNHDRRPGKKETEGGEGKTLCSIRAASGKEKKG